MSANPAATHQGAEDDPYLGILPRRRSCRRAVVRSSMGDPHVCRLDAEGQQNDDEQSADGYGFRPHERPGARERPDDHAERDRSCQDRV